MDSFLNGDLLVGEGGLVTLLLLGLWLVYCPSGFVCLILLYVISRLCSVIVVLRRFISACAVFAWYPLVATDPVYFYADSVESDQPSRTRRLIRVFAGCTCRKSCTWLKYLTSGIKNKVLGSGTEALYLGSIICGNPLWWKILTEQGRRFWLQSQRQIPSVDSSLWYILQSSR